MIDRKNETVTIRIRGHKVPVKARVVWSFASDGEMFHRVKTPASSYWVSETDLVLDIAQPVNEADEADIV